MKDPDFEKKVESVLSAAWGGVHNVDGWERRKPCGDGIAVVVHGSLATYDFGTLTALVIRAHDEAVRLEIQPASPKYLRLVFHPRKRDGGQVWERHPTMEWALERARGGRIWKKGT